MTKKVNNNPAAPLTDEEKAKVLRAFEKAYEVTRGQKVKLSWADCDSIHVSSA
jgi:hypothetical protein